MTDDCEKTRDELLEELTTLRASEHFYRTTLENLSDLVFVTDDQGWFIYVCPEVQASLGFQVEDIQRLGNVSALLGADLFDPAELRDGVEMHGVERVVHDSQGREHVFLIDIKRLAVQDNTILLVCRDITDHKQTEEKLYALINAVQDTLFLMDLDGTLVIANETMAKRFRKRQEDLPGTNAFELLAPDVAQHRKRLISQVIDNGVALAAEDQRGEYYLESRMYPVRDKHGQVTHVAVYGHDITAQRNIEQELWDREKRYYQLYHDAPLAYFAVGTNGLIRNANQQACVLLGADFDTLIGSPVLDLYADTPHGKAKARRVFERFVSGKTTSSEELQMVRRDGLLIWVLLSVHIVHDDDGTILESFSVVQDITKRKLAQEALSDSERRFRTLAELAPIGIYLADASGNCQYANAGWLEMAGLTLDETLGSGWHAGLHPDDRDRIAESWQQMVGASGQWGMECRFQTPEGKITWVYGVVASIIDDAGQITGYMGVNLDITARKLAEEKLHQYQHIVSSMLDAVSLVDLDYVYQVVNEAYLQRTNRQRDEIEGHPVAEISGEDDFETLIRPRFERCLAGENVHFQAWLDFEVAGHRYMDVTYSPYRDASGHIIGVLVNGRDITAQQQIEAALRDSEERHRLLAAYVTDVISRHDLDGIYLDITASCRALGGYEPHELIGTNSYDYFHPEDIPALRVSHHTITHQDVAYTVEYRFRHKQGHYIWLESVSRVVDTGTDTPYILVVTRDIAARKETERQIRLNEERLQSLLNLSQLHELSEKEFIDFALEEMVRLTDSEIGYLHFVEPDQQTVRLYTWSAKVRETCEITELSTHYPLGQAGVWADCVQTGHSVIHNDYQQLENKQGYPAGHTPIYRHVSVPVFHNGVIVTIVGVGNRQEPYTESDARQLLLFANTMWEILERRQTEIALQESRRRYQILFDSMLDGYALHEIICDDDGNPIDYRFLDVNAAFKALTHLGAEIIGRRVLEVLPGIEPYWIETYGQVALTGKPVRFENFSGEVGRKWFEVVAFQTQPNQFATIFQDVTERKHAEEALRESEERFRLSFEYSQAGIALVTLEGRFIDVNRRVCEILGYTHDELLALDYLAITHPDDHQRSEEHFKQLQKSDDDGYSLEKRYLHKNGRIIWGVISVAMVRDANNNPVYATVQLFDITDRKRAEEALREGESQLHTLFEYSPIAIWVEDFSAVQARFAELRATGIGDMQTYLTDHPEEVAHCAGLITVLDINQASVRLFEANSKDEISLDLAAYFTAEAMVVFRDELVALASGQTHFEAEIPVLRPNGGPGTFFISLAVAPGYEVSLGRVLVSIIDITDRKHAEESERDQRQLATALVTTAEIINSTLDFDEVLDRILSVLHDVVPHDGANIMLINEARTGVRLVDCCGCYEESGLVAPDTDVILPLAQYPHLQHMIENRTALAIPDTADDVWLQDRWEPSVRSYVGAPIEVEGHVIGFLNANSATPGAFTERHAIRLRGFATQAAVAIHNAQMYQRLSSYSEDLEQAVSERTAELMEANVELERLSRIKDEFVANVSHELRSPITSFTLRHHLLRRQPDRLTDHLEVLERETARLQRTVDDLLRLSRLDQGRTEINFLPIDLNQMARYLVQDRGLLAEQNTLTLRFEAADDLPVVIADQGLLEQVLSIMLTNAINYTLPGGRIMVRTHTARHEGQDWVGFSVMDTGLGISPDEQARLFERFFQGSANRKAKVSGTGLGLAIAKEIIRRHNGRIEVESTGVPGEQTTFFVWLPAGKEDNGKITAGR